MNVLGITIGIGDVYKTMAESAAERFTKFTGIDTEIIDQNHFDQIGIIKRFKHLFQQINAIKLFIFDLFDVENVIFFDADVCYMQSWNPREFLGEKCVFAVQDCHPWMQEFATFNDLDVRSYFNGGFFIINRTHHKRALEFAYQIYDSLKMHRFGEQEALVASFFRLGIPIHMLDKRYNWVDGGLGAFKHGVIGWHTNGVENVKLCKDVYNGKVEHSVANVNPKFLPHGIYHYWKGSSFDVLELTNHGYIVNKEFRYYINNEDKLVFYGSAILDNDNDFMGEPLTQVKDGFWESEHLNLIKRKDL